MESLVPQHSYSIEKAVLALLPAFVAAKIQDVALGGRRHALFTYHELAGSIESRDNSKRIAFWMNGAWRERYWIHQSGSHCWIVPTSFVLRFETIAPEQLTGVCDPRIWWAVYSIEEDDRRRSLHVYKVTVVAENEVLGGWNDDMVFP